MRRLRRPHLIGIDDGPFDKRRDREVVVVGVMMEGSDLVEGVAMTHFQVDGDDATGFLARWVRGLRFWRGTQGIVIGGITIAGLGVIDVPGLAEATGVPVLVVNRRDPSDHRLADALAAAQRMDRLAQVERCPPARRLDGGLYLACAGIEPDLAAAWIQSARRKSDLPEPLRLAHLIGRAFAIGESRGRA